MRGTRLAANDFFIVQTPPRRGASKCAFGAGSVCAAVVLCLYESNLRYSKYRLEVNVERAFGKTLARRKPPGEHDRSTFAQ